MSYRINLNADIGEGFGAYDIGNDADLMTVIRSASVACGFHAGDANTMHSLTMLAKQNNLVQAARSILDMGPKALIVKHGEYGATAFFRLSSLRRHLIQPFWRTSPTAVPPATAISASCSSTHFAIKGAMARAVRSTRSGAAFCQ